MQMSLGPRIFSSFVAAPLLWFLLCQDAVALDWPDRAIHVIVPFSPGSAVDSVPRVVLQQLSDALHQPIIVENRGGAGGTIGSAAVARSIPDGYTLMATTSSLTAAPSIYPANTRDPSEEFSGIIMFGSMPNVLVVAPTKGFKTVADLVSAARARPGTMTFASAGIGSATHFSAERFRMSAAIDLIHVPFKGAPEAYAEVMSGRVDFYFGALATALPLINDGRLVALAVNSRTRVADLPDVPTTEEAGFPNSQYTFWIGLFAPAKTPRAVVDQLHDRLHEILQLPSLQQKLDALSVQPMPLSMVEIDALVRQETVKNRLTMKNAGLKPD